MKAFFWLLVTLFPATLIGQPTPVEWKPKAVQISPGKYHILLEGTIVKNWHLYAEKDTETGLEPISISFDGDHIKNTNVLTARNSNLSILHPDPVFKKKLKVYKDSVVLVQPIAIKGKVPDSLLLIINGFASNDQEFVPLQTEVLVALPGGVAMAGHPIKLSTVDLQNPVKDCGDNQTEDKGLFSIFLLGMLGGLFALITPCVFPMVPVTVSFFMNRSGNKISAIKKGILYGSFIFLIYVLASSPFHLVGGIDKNIFNSIATNAWVNLVFFAIFLLFALSFFGLFEITLPGGLATKADSKSNLGSVPGIFFMALTLAIVSFSCTGVILGVLLAGVAANGPWALTIGMAGFGLALALPFALFAIFPHLLKSLPKSGGWLDTVKKVLAFVELALAFKFLSNADLVERWGLLKREVFIGIWILISLGLSLYLFGVFDQRKVMVSGLHISGRLQPVKQKLSSFRVALGLIPLVFAAYLLPGVTRSEAANLQLLSGFPPPLSYSIYGRDNVKGKGLEPDVINDYERAVQLSREQGKPILIDFTGWACVNCRKMEEQVWVKDDVKKIIEEKYILVSLYVDDRKRLKDDASFRYHTASGEVKVKTVGDQWALFQSENFGQVTQPLYVILSPDGKLMNHPVGYTPNASDYANWLKCGIEAYEVDHHN